MKRPTDRQIRAALVFLLAFACLATRRLDQLAVPQLKNEDGAIFFHSVLVYGPSWRTIFAPYSGYLHLVPWLIATAASVLPLEWVPLAYNLAAFAITSLVVARVAMSRLPPVAAAACAIGLLAVPTNGTIFAIVANLHFMLAAVIAINLLEPAPESAREMYRRSAEMLIASLSGPEGVVLLPFAIVRAWISRNDRRGWQPLAVFGGGASVQLIAILCDPRPAYAAGTVQDAIPSLGLAARYAKLLFGGWFDAALDMRAAFLVLALAVAAWLVVFWAREQRMRRQAFLVLLGGIAMLLAGRLAGPHWPNPFGFQARHAFLPFVAVFWSFGLLCAGLPGKWKLLPAAALGAIFFSALPQWTADPVPNLHWRTQIAEIRSGNALAVVDPEALGTRCIHPIPNSFLLWVPAEHPDGTSHPHALCVPAPGWPRTETAAQCLARMRLR